MAKNVSDAYVRESINAQLDELEGSEGVLVFPSGCSRERFDLLFLDVLEARRDEAARSAAEKASA